MDNRQVFVLEILDNQEGTWQGRLQWNEGQEEKPFLSMLQMLRLIDSALDGKKAEDIDPERWAHDAGWGDEA